MAYIPSTVDEQYEYGKSLEISYRALHHDAYLHDKQSNRTIRIPFMSILSKYRDFLDEIIVEQELTLDEQRVYRIQRRCQKISMEQQNSGLCY